MLDFSLNSIVSKTAAGLTLVSALRRQWGMSGIVATRKWRFQLRLRLIVAMLQHRPDVARYSGFSRKAKTLDFYVTYSLPIKK